MIRIEIIGNQSVYTQLAEALEECLPDFLYTIIPLAHGKGKTSFKLGDSTWPETNFMLIAYAEDGVESEIHKIVDYIKKKFPTEGIKCFVMHDSCRD